MSSLSLPGGREFLMCILGFDSPWCSSPIFSQKHKFSYCSSRCLDPALAVATAVELDSISNKFGSIPGTFPSGSGQALWCTCPGTHTHKTVLASSLERPVFPRKSSIESLFYFRKCHFSSSAQALSRPCYGITCARQS